MSFVLETIQTTNKKELLNIVQEFEFSNHRKSKCYEEGKSENLEQTLIPW